MHTVMMTNFNIIIYSGNDRDQALLEAVKCGFECTLTQPEGTWCYSPIFGWRRATANDLPSDLTMGAQTAKRLASAFMPHEA